LNQSTAKSAPKAFKRSSRLTGQAEFRRVFSRPKVSQDQCFRVLSRANDLHHPRLGMAVSVKTCKRATGRNRLKRLVRESFRQQAGAFRSSGIDLVVLPTRQAATMCNKTLFSALEAHWQRALAATTLSPAKPQGKN
jgi:ribonuclease P protein component